MRSSPGKNRQGGFSLLELLMAMAIFTLICGVAFSLLGVSQRRNQTETQLLNSLQEARLGMDEMVRDINDAGYPPPNHYYVTPAANLIASVPFAWNPGYPAATPCTIGGTCATPSAFDLIVETDIDPQKNNGVEWVRYQLQGTTLYRGVVSKAAGADPATVTAAALVPYVQNVMNNAPAAQIATIQASYPAMFPAGAAVPIFTYTCDNGNGSVSCASAATNNAPANIRDVEITLIVSTSQVDAQTGQPRLVELRGRGHRVNPNH